MTDPTPTPTPHRATPDQWEELQTPANSRYYITSVLLELAARVEALEAQQQAQPEPEPEPEQSLHAVALGMVDSLGRSFGLLPQILDTLRRAIREPMDPPAPCPHIRSSDKATSYSELVRQVATEICPTSVPIQDSEFHARGVLRVVARWLRANGWSEAPDRLEQEAGR